MRLFILFFILLPCLLFASDEVEVSEPIKDWKKELRLSLSSNSGNTDKESLSTRIKIEKPKGEIRFFGDLAYYLEREDNKESENKLTLDARTEHTITNSFFYLFNGYYRRDKFSGIKNRAYVGAGLGLTVIDTKKHQLKVLDSLNYEYEKLQDKTSNSNVVNAIRVTYEYNILDKVKIGEDVKHTIALNATKKYYVDSETYVNVALNKYLSFVLSYIVNYQNELSEGDYKHTDRKLLVSIAVNF